MRLFLLPGWRISKWWRIVLVFTVSLILTTPIIFKLISHADGLVPPAGTNRIHSFFAASYDDVTDVNAKRSIDPATDNGVQVNADDDDDADDDANEEEEEGETEARKKEPDAERVKRELLSDPLRNERLSKMYDYCHKRPVGSAVSVIYDNRRTSSLCKVPKAGCTHWIKIFRFIDNNTGGVVYNTPAEIPRWSVHWGKPLNKIELHAKAEPGQNHYFESTSFLADTFRFMFVRHPIRRLWSAWLDKFLLPDHWFPGGRRIAQLLQLEPIKQTCPTNITFNQFLRYVTHNKFKEKPGDLNEHWRPIMYLCDPCLFRPHLLGKMETFDQDSKIALSAMNIEPYLEERSKAGGTKAKASNEIDDIKKGDQKTN